MTCSRAARASTLPVVKVRGRSAMPSSQNTNLRNPLLEDELETGTRAAEDVCLEKMQLPDGRTLAYAVYGALLESSKSQVVYFHGTPSCYMEAAVLHEDAWRLGVSIVSLDRPGVGGSSYHGRRTLESTTEDALALMQELGITKAAVIGCSGGAPYAAALAMRHPQRVGSLTIISGVGPTDWRHRSLLRAMSGMDRVQFGVVHWHLGLAWALHALLRRAFRWFPDKILEHAPEGMDPADAELIRTDERVRANFAPCMQHAYLHGARGMAKDVAVLGSTWKSDLSQLACRTTIWHGTADTAVPPVHGRWYHETVSGSKLNLLEGEGHVTPLVKFSTAILEEALGLALA